MILLAGGTVYTPLQKLPQTSVAIDDGRIARVAPADAFADLAGPAETIDVSDCIVCPRLHRHARAWGLRGVI